MTGVEGFQPGDEVVVRPLDPRGETPADRGLSHISRNLKFLGIDAPGALQRSWTVPAFTLHALPATVDLRLGALAEPLAVACHDVRRGEVREGQLAVVIGGGPIGLLIALVAGARGARVLVVEPDPTRRELAGELGLDALDPGSDDVAARVLDESEGAGADVVFEVSGSAAGMLAATGYACLRGRIVVVAIFPEPKPVALFEVFFKELDIRGVRVYEPEDFDAAIELLAAGSLDLERLITAVEPLERVPEMFEELLAGRAGDEDPGRLPRVNAAPFDLSGRTALVTGCRRGIGKAAAVALAAAGADVVGVSATLEEGSEVAAAVEAHGRSFAAYRCDLGNRAEVHELVAAVRRDHERIDILVNNAGTIARAPAAEHPDELWDHVLEVNLTAQFILARELGRDMVARGSGKIVFVASLLSFQGGITVPGYTASKSGVAGLTKALANEWASHGVNVNAVAPGYVQTDNTQALRDDPVRFEQILARIPGRSLGRAGGHRGSRGLPLLAGGRLRATASSFPSTGAGSAGERSSERE